MGLGSGMSKKIAVAITGASGAIYSLRLIRKLKDYGCEVHLVMSDAAIQTLKSEVDLEYARDVFSRVDVIYENNDIGGPLASGSFRFDALVVIPCSVKTIGIIHSGLANTLIGRCAVVAHKEKRQIILAPREMPMSPLTLKQLYELAMMGLCICPASPGFYNKPKTLDDLIDFVIAKILNLLGFPNDLIPEWNPDR
jgi:4-hydroxy-3-polyprenylbenzoate decarboxylase